MIHWLSYGTMIKFQGLYFTDANDLDSTLEFYNYFLLYNKNYASTTYEFYFDSDTLALIWYYNNYSYDRWPSDNLNENNIFVGDSPSVLAGKLMKLDSLGYMDNLIIQPQYKNLDKSYDPNMDDIDTWYTAETENGNLYQTAFYFSEGALDSIYSYIYEDN